MTRAKKRAPVPLPFTAEELRPIVEWYFGGRHRPVPKHVHTAFGLLATRLRVLAEGGGK